MESIEATRAHYEQRMVAITTRFLEGKITYADVQICLKPIVAKLDSLDRRNKRIDRSRKTRSTNDENKTSVLGGGHYTGWYVEAIYRGQLNKFFKRKPHLMECYGVPVTTRLPAYAPRSNRYR